MAFWLVNKEQANLQHEKVVADQTLALLQNPELPVLADKKSEKSYDHWRSGYVHRCANFSYSTLGKKKGSSLQNEILKMVTVFFTPIQILLIRTLRRTVYYWENMKEIIHAGEHQDIEKAKEVTENALLSIHERNRQ